MSTQSKTQRFQGKVAVVTGGNSGIGLAAAKAYAREGARVAIFGRDKTTLEQARRDIGPDTIAVQGDIAKLADIDRLIGEVKAKAGRIDALFVNAGVGKFVPIEASDEQLFDWTFDINVKGAYFTIQKALPLMGKGSAIVLNGSCVVEMGMPATSIYAATKAAVNAFARSLTSELAPKGVRINVVNPGPVETPIFNRMGLDADTTKSMVANIQSQVPLGRMGNPEELADAVLFLTSDDSSYIHGASLLVDGGLSRP
jgi:NAD(P)-dependent dehydrogenase (short-subunit alcohol dehydrogenase family)